MLLDHCNALLYGLPAYLIQRLQYVMNAAAKVITCKRKFDYVTPLLAELQWLPVRQRIAVKIISYTFKALHGVTPTYLTELISPYFPSIYNIVEFFKILFQLSELDGVFEDWSLFYWWRTFVYQLLRFFTKQ